MSATTLLLGRASRRFGRMRGQPSWIHLAVASGSQASGCRCTHLRGAPVLLWLAAFETYTFFEQSDGEPCFDLAGRYTGPLPRSCAQHQINKTLLGVDPGTGKWATAAAASYPDNLCKFLATIALTAWRRGMSRPDKAMGAPRQVSPPQFGEVRVLQARLAVRLRFRTRWWSSGLKRC